MSEEKTLFKGTSSLVINLGGFILGTLSIVAGLALGFLYSYWFFILAGLGLVFLLVQWLKIRFRVYEVTTERIRLTTGVLTRRTDELELYRVQDFTLIEPLAARLAGAGTIKIVTMDPSTPALSLEYISGARQLREELRKSVEACRDRKRVRVAELE